MDNENDIPRHRKQRNSDKSKSKKKSNHKHIYEEEILLKSSEYNHEFYMLGKRCTICGKIRIIESLFTEPVISGMGRLLSNEEVLQKYSNLPIIDY